MLTKQEMFDRAYIGLASQGFEQCTTSLGTCIYTSNDGSKHCAWGWVDPAAWALTAVSVPSFGASLDSLISARIGIAADLYENGLYTLASALQGAHDSANSADDMKVKFRQLAQDFNLTIPELP